MDKKAKLQDPEFRKAVRDELVKAASTEKKYTMALVKIANLQQEVEVYKTVLKLIEDGIVDRYEGLDKAAEYMDNKEQFDTAKEAHEVGIPLDMFSGLEEDKPLIESDRKDEDFFVNDLKQKLT